MRFLLLAMAAALWAQEAPKPVPPPAAAAEPSRPLLQNTGQPMRVPFQCGAEDIHSFGLTCPTRQPCPVYLDLSGLASASTRLFAAGNLHAESTTLFSVLLASDDEGKTWYEPYERIRGAGLDQVEFYDLTTGWISGAALGSVPRDPFFLLTTDAGKTWRLRPLWSDSRAVGVIDWFHFDSKTHGLLWLDRSQAGEGNPYESYESMTGGDSWSLREGTKTPPKTAKAQPAGWRLRADPRTRSYLVERQAGERWQPVASFLVQVGECREPEVPAEP